MTQPTTYIATPCYGGNINVHCMVSIMGAVELGIRTGRPVQFLSVSGESLIQRARNNLVHTFLTKATSDDDAILFVDGDIRFDPHLPGQLRDTGFDVVGCAYPKKEHKWEEIEAKGRDWGASYFVRPLAGDTDKIPMRRNCIPVRYLGTGMLYITRRAILAMQDAYPELMYISDGGSNLGSVVWSLFDCVQVDGQYYSEDYTFCHRWRAIGGDVQLYLKSAPSHIGVCEFKGNLNTFLTVNES